MVRLRPGSLIRTYFFLLEFQSHNGSIATRWYETQDGKLVIGFNPIMVRLRLNCEIFSSSRGSEFQSHNGSIATCNSKISLKKTKRVSIP